MLGIEMLIFLRGMAVKVLKAAERKARKSIYLEISLVHFPVLALSDSEVEQTFGNLCSLYEPPQVKTSKMTVCPAKTQTTWASAQSDQSLCCALTG